MNPVDAPRLDPRMTFDTFVVGPANRLAAAAARRAAEWPGSSFNPLFLYAPSGLGKSHILSAIANHAARVHPDRAVVYRTLEEYLDELTRTLERAGSQAMHEVWDHVGILLLDDVQFLTGHPEAQQLLLRTLDRQLEGGGQVVLASDRPPAEIDGLDGRLLARFSGGLIVDMGAPDYETRVAILRRKAEGRGESLGEGVAEAMARHPFRNVRELQGALNRVLVIQELEERPVGPDEVAELLRGIGAGAPESTGPGRERAGSEASDEDEPAWRRELRSAVRAAESEGFEVRRLSDLLAAPTESPGWAELLEGVRARMQRLHQIAGELEALEAFPGADRRGVLLDPDRVEEAEQLLVEARERMRGFPPIPPGPALGELEAGSAALPARAAERLLLGEHHEYNPLFLKVGTEADALAFLGAVGRRWLELHPAGRVALVSVEEFASDLIRALSEGVSPAWRERWWSVDLLLLHGVERLGDTERAQDEFFHLFEALTRGGGRLVLASDRPPGQVEGVDVRLLSRFEGGLVLDLPAGVASEVAASPAAEPPTPSSPAGSDPSPAPHPSSRGADFPPPEKVVWDWPAVEDLVHLPESLG